VCKLIVLHLKRGSFKASIVGSSFVCRYDAVWTSERHSSYCSAPTEAYQWTQQTAVKCYRRYVTPPSISGVSVSHFQILYSMLTKTNSSHKFNNLDINVYDRGVNLLLSLGNKP